MSGSASGSALNAVVAQGYNPDPTKFIGNWLGVANQQQDLQQKQFNLQQAQLGPAYQAMRQIMATNENPTWDDVNNALAQSRRIGANVDGLVANATETMSRGGKASDFMRAYALGGMTAAEQAALVGPRPVSVNTGPATVFGTVGGAWTPQAGQFTTTGSSIAHGLTPEAAAQNVQVGVDANGAPIMAPRGGVNWPGVSGGGTGNVQSTGGATPSAGAISSGQGVPAGNAQYNYGNIRAPGGGFQNYATPQDGIAAMTSNLTAYQDQHGINTLNGITARWAPYGDGNNNPVAYANTISKLTGIDPNAQLDLHDPATLAKIIPAMAQVEHGRPMSVSGDVLNNGIQVGLSGGGGGRGPFIGATSAQPVVAGGGMQYAPGAVQRTGGGGIAYGPTGQPLQAGGGGGGIPGVGGTPGTYTGYTGLPPGFEQTVQPQIARANQLQQGMAANIQTSATLQGMEAELNNLPATGVPSGALGTLRNLAVSSGLVNQQTADSWARTQSAQEQFEKFASLLQQQQLGALTGQATDERQALTAASTPSILHTKLGNLGIIHMLEGNQSALMVMGRAWQQAVSSGQASPQQFDAWRNQFTEPDKSGGRFDPRVFWMAQMGTDEQRRYGSTLTAKDQQQLKRNVQYAEQHNWIHANDDGSFGTSY